MEGKSLIPVFDNKQLDREAIYWEHEGNRAVRMGKWKLVSKAHKQAPRTWDEVNELSLESWELFDMEQDRTEMNNLAAQYSELVEKMAGMWLGWGKRTGIVPRPGS